MKCLMQGCALCSVLCRAVLYEVSFSGLCCMRGLMQGFFSSVSYAGLYFMLCLMHYCAAYTMLCSYVLYAVYCEGYAACTLFYRTVRYAVSYALLYAMWYAG